VSEHFGGWNAGRAAAGFWFRHWTLLGRSGADSTALSSIRYDLAQRPDDAQGISYLTVCAATPNQAGCLNTRRSHELNGGAVRKRRVIWRHRRFARSVHAASLALLALVLLPAAASGAIAGGLDWQAPTTIDPGVPLIGVTCAAESLCVVADRVGNIVTTTDPGGDAAAWHISHLDNHIGCGRNGVCWVRAISCVSASFCAASDLAGYVFTSTNPAAGADAWSSAKVASMNAMSCPSSSLCVGLDYYGKVFTSTNPLAGADTWQSSPIFSTSPSACTTACGFIASSEERPLDEVSCPSLSLCVVGDWFGHVHATTNPTGGSDAWSSAYIDSNRLAYPMLNPQTPIRDVSCPSERLCVVTDGVGDVITSQNPTGDVSAWRLSRAAPSVLGAPQPPSMYTMACASVSFCTAVRTNGQVTPPNSEVVLTYNPLAGLEWTRAFIDSAAPLSAISCPSSSLCVAVDESGNVIVGRAPTPEQIRAAITPQVAPRGRPARIREVLRHRGFLLAFNPPVPGHVSIRWLLSRATRSHKHARPVVVARGQTYFAEPQPGAVALKLTRAGIRTLRHRKHARLTAEAVLTGITGQAVTASERFSLRR
jgi:hypothetical protein